MGLFDWLKKPKKKRSSLSSMEKLVLRHEKAEQRRLNKKKKLMDLKNSFTDCPICKCPINSATMFFCRYCKKGFCETHRLPENHKCKDPKLPYPMRKGYGVKQLSDSSNYPSRGEKESN